MFSFSLDNFLCSWATCKSADDDELAGWPPSRLKDCLVVGIVVLGWVGGLLVFNGCRATGFFF